MKRFLSSGLAVLLLIAVANATVYNYASVQPDKSFSVIGGQEVNTRLYFYNYYGDTITHISLFPINVPDGWVVEITPSLNNDTFDVSGQEVIVEENLFVAPEEAYSNRVVEDGYEYIQVAGIDGYVKAKVVNVRITVPEDVDVGDVSSIKIGSSAAWLSLSEGTVNLNQERSFNFALRVVPEDEYIVYVGDNTGFSIIGFFQDNGIVILSITLVSLSVAMLYMMFLLKNKKDVVNKKK
ncbi:MAG: hypothetical protein WC307_00130 [Candidatus Nanoarchaeia archaeon]|jgi:hypothetical protein